MTSAVGKRECVRNDANFSSELESSGEVNGPPKILVNVLVVKETVRLLVQVLFNEARLILSKKAILNVNEKGSPTDSRSILMSNVDSCLTFNFFEHFTVPDSFRI